MTFSDIFQCFMSLTDSMPYANRYPVCSMSTFPENVGGFHDNLIVVVVATAVKLRGGLGGVNSKNRNTFVTVLSIGRFKKRNLTEKSMQ